MMCDYQSRATRERGNRFADWPTGWGLAGKAGKAGIAGIAGIAGMGGGG